MQDQDDDGETRHGDYGHECGPECAVWGKQESDWPHRHWCERCYAFWAHSVDDQPECKLGSLLTKSDIPCPEHREKQEEP